LEAKVRNDPNLKLRKVDIVEWGSAVSNQYRIRSIPHLMLFRDGNLVAEGLNEVLALLP
jgi:thioredoxin-like negative regulator of GroEL